MDTDTVICDNSDNSDNTDNTYNTSPDISIILPVFNGQEYLAEAITSILNQTFHNFELIIVNDGSTDNTPNIISSFHDCRIKVINQNNQKLPTALNNGFKAALGPYVTWTSDDNLLDKDAFMYLKKALDEKPDIDFVYAGHTVFGTINFRVPGLIVPARDMLLNFKGLCCYMWRKQIMDFVGYFDPDLNGVEDWDYWIRVMEHNPICASVNKLLYKFRMHKNNASHTIRWSLYTLETRMAQKIMERNGNANQILDIGKYYPALFMCQDINRAKCIAYFDMATAIATYRKRAISVVLSKNLDIYFQLSHECDSSYVPAIINLVISKHKMNRLTDIDKYVAILGHIESAEYGPLIQQILNKEVSALNYVKANNKEEELFVKEREFLKQYQVDSL